MNAVFLVIHKLGIQLFLGSGHTQVLMDVSAEHFRHGLDWERPLQRERALLNVPASRARNLLAVSVVVTYCRSTFKLPIPQEKTLRFFLWKYLPTGCRLRQRTQNRLSTLWIVQGCRL